MKKIFKLFQILLLLVLLEPSIGMGGYIYYETKNGGNTTVVIIDQFDESGNAVFEKSFFDIKLEKAKPTNSNSDVEFRLKKGDKEIPLFVLRLKDVTNAGFFSTANFTFEIEKKSDKINLNSIYINEGMDDVPANNSNIVIQEDKDTSLNLYFDSIFSPNCKVELSVDEGISFDAEIEKLNVTINKSLVDSLTSGQATSPSPSPASAINNTDSLDFILATLDKKLVSDIFETKTEK
jgi:hypothetical protein